MIVLDRRKENKWIFQKNLSSKDLILAYLSVIQNNGINYDNYLLELKKNNKYRGRSDKGSKSTLGVRMSQMCFYMFGYKKDNKFILSSSSQMYNSQSRDIKTISLINLFSMQYPNPFSNTPNNFKIYVGRLILKLLTEERIENKIYIDEFIWFLPFIEKINNSDYEKLIKSIIEYRKLRYEEKITLFKSIENYNDIFSNCMHESLYYFARIFEAFDVFKLVEDYNHNEGKLIKFIQGKSTKRVDAIKSRGKVSGYIKLNEELINYTEILLKNNSFTDIPSTESDSLNRDDWIKDLYEFNMLSYFCDIDNYDSNLNELHKTIKTMVYNSKYGTNDGKSFEQSLAPCFELFREIENVEILSGAGNTDLLCNVHLPEERFKINVDAKKSKDRLNSINPIRIRNHQKKHGSIYSIIVAPKFSKGAKTDISEYEIVTVNAETLANYCLKGCLTSNDGKVDYYPIDHIIKSNYGKDITKDIEKIIVDKYSIC